MAHTKGRRTFLLRSGLWVTTGLVTAGTGLGVAHAGGPKVTFYEGNRATQDVVKVYNLGYNQVVEERIWPNDEARSCVLENFPRGSTITVYDKPEPWAGDDYCIISVKEANSGKVTVDSFELDFIGHTIDVSYRFKNGLDGKVSYVWISTKPNQAPPGVPLSP